MDVIIIHAFVLAIIDIILTKRNMRAILKTVKQMLAVQLLVLRKTEDSMMDSNFAALQQLHSSLRVAIYCRLSKDDNLDGESASIHNQRDMLETWCQEHGFTVAGVYAEM